MGNINVKFKRENEISRENANIGDEVVNVHGTVSIIVGIKEDTGEFILCFASSETKRPKFYVYDEHESNFNYCVKTGVTYDYIRDLFDKKEN